MGAERDAVKLVSTKAADSVKLTQSTMADSIHLMQSKVTDTVTLVQSDLTSASSSQCRVFLVNTRGVPLRRLSSQEDSHVLLES